MKNYEVVFVEKFWGRSWIEAASEDEARKIACDMMSGLREIPPLTKRTGYEIFSIEEVVN